MNIKGYVASKYYPRMLIGSAVFFQLLVWIILQNCNPEAIGTRILTGLATVGFVHIVVLFLCLFDN